MNDRVTLIVGYYYTRTKEEGFWSTTHRSCRTLNHWASVNLPLAIRERIRTQLRAEFFNAFNTVNLNNPFAQANSAARFGRIESAADPRIIQVAVRLAF